jgi:hypothetical protein
MPVPPRLPPVDPAYSGPPGAWYDISHAGEIARGTEQNIRESVDPAKTLIDYFSGTVGTSSVPRGRAAVVWIVIITVGVIGISGLLRPGTNVVVRMAK